MTEPRALSTGFHERLDRATVATARVASDATPFAYTVRNFFHPFVGELIERLNQSSVAGLLDPDFHESLATDFFAQYYTPATGSNVTVAVPRKEIDLSIGGPYANYNWELMFHIPVAIAVHLSRNQRFADAQRWFHYVFDPTSTDTKKDPPARYWRFLRFRDNEAVQDMAALLRLLSKPGPYTAEEEEERKDLFNAYGAIRNAPFQAHRVAATRTVSYQYHVVMKYLDNLIAWGDSLFREDTAESITEATQRYILAANILGPRPQQLPARGTRAAKTFAQLKDDLNVFGNALVDLESQFPFNFVAAPGHTPPGAAGAPPVSGFGRTLYFCVPRNDRLLAYWDRVADRLFKVRNCMNLQGVTRQLALFEPAIDPSLLVKAAAAGIDASAAGNPQPAGPLRAPHLIQFALELADEVRGLGASLLSAIEKTDAESLVLLRQGHELAIQQLIKDLRFLQWRQAQAATDALVRSRGSALERYNYYHRVLGLQPLTEPPFVVGRPSSPDAQPLLTEANFDGVYAAMVGQYDRSFADLGYPDLKLVGSSSPTSGSGETGTSQLNLITKEDQELNRHLPAARDLHVAASVIDTVASVVTLLPEIDIDLHFWGLGAHSKVFGGSKLSDVSKIAAGIIRTKANWEQDQAAMAARTASYERRTDEWTLQLNLAAHELGQLGRNVLSSVITEQVAHREYLNVSTSITNAQEVDRTLRTKFSNTDLYGWMQGEVTRVYYDCYRFAVDVARKAEQAIERELMPTEQSAVPYIKTNYWDSGRRGLLAADALILDLKRMDLAYREGRRREYELVRHVSLAQLDPIALLQLRTAGSCEISIPESLFDLDCPGHYLRRIKRVSLSIPAVTGPYIAVNCTLSLLRSSIRTTATGSDYPRRQDTDIRFVDYVGTIQSVVTSTGQDDSGMFDALSADDRFLPFEAAGAVSSWRLELPSDFRQFDYATIPDVLLHVRYTARDGGALLRTAAVQHLQTLVSAAQATGSARLLSVRQDFPDSWTAFQNTTRDGRAALTVTLRDEHYPYWSQGRVRTVHGVELLARPASDATAIDVFYGVDDGAPHDALTADPSVAPLLRGALAHLDSPPAVGDVKVYFDDPSAVSELWLIVTWGD